MIELYMKWMAWQSIMAGRPHRNSSMHASPQLNSWFWRLARTNTRIYIHLLGLRTAGATQWQRTAGFPSIRRRMHKESLSLSLAMASLQKSMFTCFLLFAAVELALAEIHKVGDSEGWTVGNISYKSWAGKRNFHVGDIIIFEYNQQFHNVLQVSRANYRSCNGTAPIASFTTGNDSIPIKRKGHYLFICGFPGHCSIGQKVDIKVVDPNAAPAFSPSFPPSSSLLPLSPPSSSASTPASAPIAVKSNHAPISKGLCFLGLAIVSMSVFFFF